MLRGAIYVLCVAAVFVAGRGVSYAEGTHLDLSNASISVTGAETFRISHTTIPGLEGAYWVDFQWNPVDLVFAPVAAGSDETGFWLSLPEHWTDQPVVLDWDDWHQLALIPQVQRRTADSF